MFTLIIWAVFLYLPGNRPRIRKTPSLLVNACSRGTVAASSGLSEHFTGWDSATGKRKIETFSGE